MNLFLVDIGATKIRFGRANGQRIVDTITHRTPTTWAEGKLLITAVKKQLFARQKVTRSVVGVPGMVALDRTRVLTVSNLPHWPAGDIVPDLRRVCRSTVVVENDAVLNGLGEAQYGAGRGQSVVGFLTISTGVNGIRIVDHQPDAHAFPVELGHLLVRYKHKDVTLWRALSGSSLERQFGRRPEFARSVAAWGEVTRTLAATLVNLGLVWAPDIIVLGGSVSKSISLPKLRREVLARWPQRLPVPPIVKGTLGDLSGLYGALALALSKKR